MTSAMSADTDRGVGRIREAESQIAIVIMLKESAQRVVVPRARRDKQRMGS